MGGHPSPRYASRRDLITVQRTDLAYLLVGAAAATERRARAAVGTTAHIAAAVAAPAVAAVEATPLAAPLRRRTAAVTDPLVADGHAVVELARRTVENAIRRLTAETLDSTVIDAAVERVLTSGAARRVVTIVINHPATDELLANTLDSPAVDRFAARVMDSRLLDDITTRLLESDELRRIVAHVSTSPEVRAALSQQTTGFAVDVTDGVRARTVVADDTVEKAARSLLRRPRRVQPD
jgi:hypothetical protein